MTVAVDVESVSLRGSDTGTEDTQSVCESLYSAVEDTDSEYVSLVAMAEDAASQDESSNATSGDVDTANEDWANEHDFEI
ncbi:unnamed protein product [Hydatigera taeniaeformis]|uniref:Transcriptional regulator n=1 Tax=Hydatigena taeniaeformis TaxID=6205 RepID=A0A0R3WWD0_HYDTA|nr:unnamed protein product [Hydatigera taeniaeformis]